MMPENKVRTTNEWADFWRYEIGMNVIPANTKYKKPIVNWTEWQSNPIPMEVHDKWKAENAFEAGMAIIVGKVWHNPVKQGLYLCAIDCDNAKAVSEMTPSGIVYHSAKTLIEWHSDDPNKCHIYFYTHKPVPKKSSDTVNPKQVQQLKNSEIPAIEVKGDGKHGIMYVTPSLHKNGCQYEIVGTEQPALIDDIPGWVDSVCKKYGLQYLDAVKNNSALIPMPDLLNDETEILEGHNRHLAMLRYADHIYATSPPSITDKLVLEMMRAKNSILCAPPLDDAELVKLQMQAKDKVKQWQAENEKAVDESAKPASKGKSHVDYADEIMEIYNFVTLDDTDEMLWYHEGVYRIGGEVLIKKRCEQIIPQCDRDVTNEVIATIKRRTYAERSAFDSDLNMINLKNCWVDIRTGLTFEHTPQWLSRVQLPVFHDPRKHPHRFVRFLRECLADPKDVYTIWEQFASCLIKSAKFGKAYMYVGQGANGKSTFLNVVRACLGAANTAHISIHRLEENRFAPAGLDGKLANIHPDIADEELRTTGTTKSLITGDPIDAEKKNKPSFSLVNFAKMFFSANQIPVVYDESDGFFRRFMIIEWNRRFTEKSANPNLINDLVTEDEKSGILNILLSMAALLNTRGYFKYAKAVDDAKTQWKTKANSIQVFFDTKLAYNDEYFVAKSRLYEAYKAFCAENKVQAKGMKKFHEDIKQLTTLIDDPIPKHIDGKSVRVWRGAALKDDFPGQEKLN